MLSHYPAVNMYIVSLPKNRLGEDTALPNVQCCSYVQMYIYLTCALSTYVQMYIVTWIWLLYMYISTCNATAAWIDDWGPNGPLLLNPAGFLLLLSKQDCFQIPLGPMVSCTLCKYLPTTSLWIVFYPSNPKASISSSPVLMYRITCTCIILCFLGALAQAFFCRQPTQGSY